MISSHQHDKTSDEATDMVNHRVIIQIPADLLRRLMQYEHAQELETGKRANRAQIFREALEMYLDKKEGEK